MLCEIALFNALGKGSLTQHSSTSTCNSALLTYLVQRLIAAWHVFDVFVGIAYFQ